MNKFTKRAEIIKKANELIAKAPTKEEREKIASIISSLLMAADLYKGFTYKYWDEKGYDEWLNAGQPEEPKEKDKFIGDKSLVVFL
jgi:hypothetical protein